ncbi:DUF3592 domain-containing protein [Rhizobium sp. Leaf262]|uniref:DUF3592 domain-containing protein n=1 Tax=Rhizobium sp. Leaf262 TaxID=1736312 RepID=UPI000714A149|nr:DUF3592 domain-containing protein [Rhizobium sp. Leaf262]KQO75669.1 hypothetical protein ASF29_10675 [Rhizobium sp. Leaf262]
MKATIKLIAWAFTVFGLVFAGVGAFFFYQDSQFAQRAQTAQGVVSEVVRKTRESSYTAIVRFTDSQGRQQEMADRINSSPPRFSQGDTVEVLYDPQSPSNALVNDLMGRYFLPGMFTILGVLIALVGIGIHLFSVYKKRRETWLLRFGQPVEAEFLHVFLDEKVSVNGANPFRVVAQGTDPQTGRIRRYESGAIWVDPTEQLQGRKLRVLIDPKTSDRHMIDLTDVVGDPA